MARIAKADVNRALDHVAKQLKIAGGAHKVSGRQGKNPAIRNQAGTDGSVVLHEHEPRAIRIAATYCGHC